MYQIHNMHVQWNPDITMVVAGCFVEEWKGYL